MDIVFIVYVVIFLFMGYQGVQCSCPLAGGSKPDLKGVGMAKFRTVAPHYRSPEYRRADGAPDGGEGGVENGGGGEEEQGRYVNKEEVLGDGEDEGAITQGTDPTDAQNRYTKATGTKPTKVLSRTPPFRMITSDDVCDLLTDCSKAYSTSPICGRTFLHRYSTFKHYCELDYVNCKEGYQIWQMAYIGECWHPIKTIENYLHYEYLGDYFMDEHVIFDE